MRLLVDGQWVAACLQSPFVAFQDLLDAPLQQISDRSEARRLPAVA